MTRGSIASLEKPCPGLVKNSRADKRDVIVESDDDLMARAATGDGQAFQLLVGAHLPPVLGLARRMLGNDQTAEDVAQEVMVKLWQHAGKWQPGRAKVSTWLHKVTANQSIDFLRRVGGQKPVPIEQGAEPSAEPVQLQKLEEAELKHKVDDALQKLPERQRLALVLCHYQGLSMREAGDIMEISSEAIESLLARARRQLRKELNNEWRALLPGEQG